MSIDWPTATTCKLDSSKSPGGYVNQSACQCKVLLQACLWREHDRLFIKFVDSPGNVCVMSLCYLLRTLRSLCYWLLVMGHTYHNRLSLVIKQENNVYNKFLTSLSGPIKIGPTTDMFMRTENLALIYNKLISVESLMCITKCYKWNSFVFEIKKQKLQIFATMA